MDDDLDNALCLFGLEDIDFPRIDVTEEQVEQFILPTVPKTVTKVNNDTRRMDSSENMVSYTL
jgi:hypothetical protein